MTMTAIERETKTINTGAKEIEAKRNLIAKKQAKIDAGVLDQWDARRAKEDIDRLAKEIVQLEEKIENAKGRLAKAEAKNGVLTEMPEAMKQLRDFLINYWDETDNMRFAKLNEKYNKLGYTEFVKKFNYSAYEFVMYETPETIHKANVREADNMIFNTIERVGEITGKITDCKDLMSAPDNNGCMILNGLIRGEKGTAVLNSIYAGGYNIQRLHIRVLVAPYKN
jgi:chromosome segregation ATPase